MHNHTSDTRIHLVKKKHGYYFSHAGEHVGLILLSPENVKKLEVNGVKPPATVPAPCSCGDARVYYLSHNDYDHANA